MKKTIILNKGGLDAIATARNIIMELYSTLNKMAARLSKNSAAGADWQFWRCLKMEHWCYRRSAAVEGSWLICVPCGQFSGSNQKGALIQSPPRGVFLRPKNFSSSDFRRSPKGLSEARLPVNVYVIEYAAKLITTNLTTKFFNENFVKKNPDFLTVGTWINQRSNDIWNMWIFFKNRPTLQVAGRKKLNFNLNLENLMFNLKKGVCEKQLKQIAKYSIYNSAFFE